MSIYFGVLKGAVLLINSDFIVSIDIEQLSEIITLSP